MSKQVDNNAPLILLRALLDGVRIAIGDDTYCLESGDVAIVGTSSVRGEILLQTGITFAGFLDLAANMTESELANTAAGNALRQMYKAKGDQQ